MRKFIALCLGLMLALVPVTAFDQADNADKHRRNFLIVNQPSESTLLNDIVAYWKLDELSGDRGDSVGSNDLTDVNTVGNDTGILGQAAQFVNANSERLISTDNADLSHGDIDFTYVAWVFFDNLSTSQQFVTKWLTSGNQRSVLWRYFLTDDRFNMLISSDGTSASLGELDYVSFGSPSTSTWYFIMFRYDASTNTMDGSVNDGTKDSASFAGGVDDNGSEFWISGSNGPSELMDGRVDEVGFWKRKLTNAEITELYNGGAGKTHPF